MMSMCVAPSPNKSVRLSASILVLLLVSWPAVGWAEDNQDIAVLRRMGKAFASIAEKASPAVVGVKATKIIKGSEQLRDGGSGDPFNPFGDDFFERFRRRSPRRFQQPEARQVAQGSGFIVTPDGYILTNNHMVGEAEEVIVTVGDGRKLKAKIIGADPETDVAVVKIDAQDLPYVELANSDSLEVGEWVIAIGNPFGLSHSVTAGIVSAKGRSQIGVADYEDFIQTDAAINFGNSGGPLLNLDGKAVGISTALIGPGGNVGIGLAIPINMAKAIYEQLKEGGKVVRGFLGVTIQDLEPGMGEFFSVENGKGAVVTNVMDGSAAQKAGIRADDIVVELEGEPVTGANELMNRIAVHKPGSAISMTVLRDGKRKTFAVTLDKRPPGASAMAPGGETEAPAQLGMSVQNLTEELKQRLGYENDSGVVVTQVESGSLADEYGLEPGVLITEVNRQPVRNVRQFREALTKAQKGGKVLLRVVFEEGNRSLVFIPLPEKK
jgi:serine protease Do